MISIDVTGDYIYAIEVKGKGKNIKVQNFCSLPLEKPLIKNDEVNGEYAASIIKEIIKDMKSKDIYLTLSASTAVSNEYILPYDKKDTHMRNMIWSNLSSTLSEEKYVMDYAVMKIFTEDNVQKCRICAYLMNRTVVKKFGEIIEQLGKKPKSFDISQNCIYKFCNSYLDNSTSVLANIAGDQIKIHLYNAPDAILTRTTMMSEVNTSTSENFDISEDGKILTSVSDQISKMLQFQAIKQHDKVITAIYLFGDLANEKAVAFIGDRFDIEVSLLKSSKPLPNMNTIPLEKYAYCIGAII